MKYDIGGSGLTVREAWALMSRVSNSNCRSRFTGCRPTSRVRKVFRAVKLPVLYLRKQEQSSFLKSSFGGISLLMAWVIEMCLAILRKSNKPEFKSNFSVSWEMGI